MSLNTILLNIKWDIFDNYDMAMLKKDIAGKSRAMVLVWLLYITVGNVNCRKKLSLQGKAHVCEIYIF